MANPDTQFKPLTMSRFYLRLILIPMALFTLVLILIRAQPYDDHELRELLLPEGCPAPCFMGIRPGVTTKDEAMKILKAGGWAKNIEKVSIYSPENITWHWGNQKPNTINSDKVGLLEIRNEHVTWLSFDTNLTLGDIRLTLGLPYAELMSGSINEPILYLALYKEFGIMVAGSYPGDVIEPLRGKISIQMSDSTYFPSQIKDTHYLNDIFRVC